MDPKSRNGKPETPPTPEVLDPAFGAKVAEWVKKDMVRADEAKKAKKKAKDDEKRG